MAWLPASIALAVSLEIFFPPTEISSVASPAAGAGAPFAASIWISTVGLREPSCRSTEIFLG